ILVVVVVIVLLAVVLGQRRRTGRLQEQFGPEYQRTVARTGDQRSAEADLPAPRQRPRGRHPAPLQPRRPAPARAAADLPAGEQRRRELDVVPLEPAARDRYVETWRVTQGKFVDDPAGATRDADMLVAGGRRERGYPVARFAQG